MTSAERVAVFTVAAVAGYVAGNAYENPHLATSPLSMAWSLGFWMREQGHATPSDVRPSVGYAMWANGALFDVTDEAAPRMIRPAPQAARAATADLFAGAVL